MRTKTLLRRLRELQNVSLTHVPRTRGSSAPVARPVSRVAADGGARAWVSSPAAQNVNPTLGSVRFMGVGSFKEGNRAGQHGVMLPHAKADGSPEKAEADAREQFLEKAKAESASNVDAVESEQTSGEATTELRFGVTDGKNTTEAIRHASEELFKRSTINAKSNESAAIKEEDKRKYPEHTEVVIDPWAPKGGAHADDATEVASPPDAPEVEARAREAESMLGVLGTHADEATASGETARENIDKTRGEMRDGKARSPQAGVIVGNVPAVGANARDTEDDLPPMVEESTDETLEKAQKAYEEALEGFGTPGELPFPKVRDE